MAASRVNSFRIAFTLLELLVVIAIIGILLALTAAAVQRVRWAAARARCANNLRQVALAAVSYETGRGHLPTGMSLADAGAEPYPRQSWLTRLLPYLEQEPVWRQSEQAYIGGTKDFTQSPPHPFTTVIPAFGCPLDGRTHAVGMARGKLPAAFTSYLGVSGTRTLRRNGVIFRNSRVRFADVPDGTSNTLMIGERPPSGDLWEGWWYAGYGCDDHGRGDMLLGVLDSAAGCQWSLTECPKTPAGFVPGDTDDDCHALHYWSLHPGGTHFAFCDGSVRFLRYSGDRVLPALATRAGGEITSIIE